MSEPVKCVHCGELVLENGRRWFHAGTMAMGCARGGTAATPIALSDAAKRVPAEKLLAAIDALHPTLARGSAALMKTWAREAVERVLAESGVDLTSTQAEKPEASDRIYIHPTDMQWRPDRWPLEPSDYIEYARVDPASSITDPAAFKAFLAEQMRDPEFAAAYRQVSAELEAELITEKAQRAAVKMSDWLKTGDGELDPNVVNAVATIIAAEFQK